MILLGDVEANQLEIREGIKIWCIVLMDWETKEIFKYPPDKIVAALKHMVQADRIVMHNYIGYDQRLLRFLFPKLPFIPYHDTLIMSRLFDPDRYLHSIESYGVECRIAKPEHEEWDRFTPEMLHRCAEDVRILDYVFTKLYKVYCEDPEWKEPLQLEYDVAEQHNKQIERGICVDVPLARNTVEVLDDIILKLSHEIQQQLPMRVVSDGEINRVFKKDGDYHANVKKFFGDDLRRAV